jgi:hypothetical protein
MPFSTHAVPASVLRQREATMQSSSAWQGGLQTRKMQTCPGVEQSEFKRQPESVEASMRKIGSFAPISALHPAVASTGMANASLAEFRRSLGTIQKAPST